MKSEKRKISTTSKYLLLLAVFSILANTILGVLLTRQSSAAIRSSMRARMLDISNTAACLLDGDILRNISPEDEGTAEYHSVMAMLTTFQDNIALSYIYCIRDMGNGEFVFGLDPSDDPAEFGSPVAYTDALYQASRGTSAVDDVPYEDAWGSFYSAYSPVFDSTGKVAGIVGVDFSREWYDAQIKAMVRTTNIACVAFLVVGIAIAMLLINKSRARVRTVNEHLKGLSVGLETLMLEVQNMAGVDISDAAGGEETERFDIDDLDSLTRKLAAMQADLHAQIDQVHEQAYFDKTTGVMNKECYLSTQNVMDDMVREGLAEFSILIFNLNELSEINRTYGHGYGDMALKDAANALSSVFGKDRVFRIGGDEFIAIAETTSLSDIQNGFSSVDFRIAAENVKEKPYHTHLSLSMGYAVFDPETDKSFMDVYRRADRMRDESRPACSARHDEA